MIVKFFTRGTGGSKGVFDYLLKDKEQPDGKRLGAEVLRGDIDNQALLIDSLDFKQKYTSGCLSFTETADEVTTEQKNALMDGFEQTIRAGLDVDRVSVSWIEHRDKGRLELNFVFANVDLEHGRAFQPYVHSVDKRRVNAWKDMQNIEYGFTDPSDPANKRLMAQRDNLPREIKDARQAITDGLQALVIEGAITNRDDVIQALTDGGFEIARETDKAISIKNPTGKRNIRLTGGLYERSFKFSPEVQNTVTAASEDYRARSTERYDAAKQLYDSEITRKRDYHQARHGKPRLEQRAAARDVSKASNRYEYSPRKLYEQRPSPFNPRFKPTRRTDRDDDRELHTAHRAADRGARGQDRAGHQIRNEEMGNRSQFGRTYDTGARHHHRGSISQQVLKTDLHHSKTANTDAAADKLRAEVSYGQEITRPSTTSPTITAGHDQTARADARRQRPRYSRIDSLIEQISSDADTRDATLADAIQYVERVDGKVHQRMGYLEKLSERARTDTGKYNRAITRLSQHAKSTSRDVERVSEYDNTARIYRERYDAIREQIEHISEYAERNNRLTSENSRLTSENSRLTSENNSLTRKIDGGIEDIRRIAEQTRALIQSKEQEIAHAITPKKSRSPRMGR
ncbi:hypothetical protein CXF58_00215 [Psychrobacter sp. Sarcosine-02u-2]|nr:relaxase/mobilization nuclease domain-containing protein [Psychrobacter sp. Sarcosine-02u-2]PKG93921.1 hypothetical protein CXF58_00215 [Psychrobacter sp. Sarcosine-02u-2]